MATSLGRLENTTVRIAALAVKTSVLGQLQVAGVKDGKLRGVGKRGAKVGVSFTVTGHTAIVKATGPFPLIESDTKAHRIPRERGARGRRRYAVIPGVGVRAFANHPGTKGKHPWAKGVAAAQPAAAKANQIALTQAMTKAYR
jgi:hypothetical protein